MTYFIKYRPTALEGAILPPQLKLQFEEMRRTQRLQCMLFYGKPGTGKSSVAQLFSTNTMVLRCDGRKTPTEVLQNAWRAATSCNLEDDSRRVIVLDEVDRLSQSGQEKVRALIDETAHLSTFIGTTNEINEVIPALQSRMTPINFDIQKGNLTMQGFWKAHLTKIFQLENDSSVPPDRLNYAMQFFPDGRRMVTALLSPVAQ